MPLRPALLLAFLALLLSVMTACTTTPTMNPTGEFVARTAALNGKT